MKPYIIDDGNIIRGYTFNLIIFSVIFAASYNLLVEVKRFSAILIRNASL